MPSSKDINTNHHQQYNQYNIHQTQQQHNLPTKQLTNFNNNYQRTPGNSLNHELTTDPKSMYAFQKNQHNSGKTMHQQQKNYPTQSFQQAHSTHSQKKNTDCRIVSPIPHLPTQSGSITSSSLNNQAHFSPRDSPELTLTQPAPDQIISDYENNEPSNIRASFQYMNDENNNQQGKSSENFSIKTGAEMNGNIDDVLANAAVSLVSNFLNENLLSKSRLNDNTDGQKDCVSPGSVSIITLSSDSEQDNQEDFDDDEDFFKEHHQLRRNNKNRSDSIKKERLSIEQFQSMNQPLNLSFNNETNKQDLPPRPKDHLEEDESSVRNEADRMKGSFEHEIIGTAVSPAVSLCIFFFVNIGIRCLMDVSLNGLLALN